MIYTIKNLARGPYNESIVRSLKELRREIRREIRGESPRNLRVTAQKSTDHHPEHVVLLEGPRGGIEIHLP